MRQQFADPAGRLCRQAARKSFQARTGFVEHTLDSGHLRDHDRPVHRVQTNGATSIDEYRQSQLTYVR